MSWIENPKQEYKRTPGGDLELTGQCCKCGSYSTILYTNHYGPIGGGLCHKCWSEIGYEDHQYGNFIIVKESNTEL